MKFLSIAMHERADEICYAVIELTPLRILNILKKHEELFQSSKTDSFELESIRFASDEVSFYTDSAGEFLDNSLSGDLVDDLNGGDIVRVGDDFTIPKDYLQESGNESLVMDPYCVLWTSEGFGTYGIRYTELKKLVGG